MPPKKIVVLGAGFGGLRAATLIAKNLRKLKLLSRYEVTLVDRNEHHTYAPLLYEAATTSKETANLAKLHQVTTHSIWSLIENFPIIFLHEEVAAIDAAGGTVRFTSGHATDFDYLVVALGAETNYFNIPGLREHALPLKTFKDAIKIRDTIWNLAMGGKETIEVVVGGGGSTGVELAGEFVSWCGELNQDFPQCRLRIKLVEAGPAILPGFAKKIVGVVEKRLGHLKVEIATSAKIVSAQQGAVTLEDGRRVPFDVFLWTGGIKAPQVLRTLPLQIEGRGQLFVHDTMECLPQTADLKLRGKIYGIGDSVCLHDPKTGKPVPAVARAAIEQAGVAACNVVQDIKVEAELTKEAHHKKYTPWEYPYITPVGGKYAVAKIGLLVIAGFWGWFLKGLVELNYLLSIMTPFRAFRTWIKGLIIFIQNDRLG